MVTYDPRNWTGGEIITACGTYRIDDSGRISGDHIPNPRSVREILAIPLGVPSMLVSGAIEMAKIPGFNSGSDKNSRPLRLASQYSSNLEVGKVSLLFLYHSQEDKIDVHLTPAVEGISKGIKKTLRR